MSQSAIRMTQFHVHALKCIGGDGGATPHHLTTRCGSTLGQLGDIMQPLGQMPVVNATPRPRHPVRCAAIINLFKKG